MIIMPTPGSLYRHFKGNYYRIIGVGTHTETEEILVIYKKDDEALIWARPLDMFFDLVDHEKYPDADQTYRFELVDEEEVWL